jgi:hypothetical protein
MLIDQLTPHLSKDNEEVNAHMKHLQEMLDAAIIVDLVLDRDDEAWGHGPDHRQSLRGDSASSLTPPEECSWRWDWDDRDLCDVIRGRDACSWIKNRSSVNKGTMITMVPITTNLTDSVLPKGGVM